MSLGRFAEHGFKLRFIFRENPIDQGGGFPFQVAGHVNKIITVPAQLFQSKEFVLRHIALRVAAKADQCGNKKRIFRISFGFSDKHLPHSTGLDWVKDDGFITVLMQPCVKGQSIVCGGFHGKHDLAFDIGELFDFLHHEVVPSAVVTDGKRFLDDLSFRCDDSDFVAALGDIDSYDKHGFHLKRKIYRQFLMVL